MLTEYSRSKIHIIPAPIVQDILSRDLAKTIQMVGETYLAHDDGQTTNPDSYFLRFPDDASKRIIALPAAIHAGDAISWIKWVSSYPRKIKAGLQRASAILVLNDPNTGYPLAVLEGGVISAVRTAASAVLGAFWLNKQARDSRRLSIIGGGFIARHIIDMFAADGWRLGNVLIHDLDRQSADHLVAHIRHSPKYHATATTLGEALAADVVVFATNAGEPYVCPPRDFAPGQIVLNISLRDVAPDLIKNSQNIFDDVSHCLKANTSPHLAELKYGNRDFVAGTISDLMRHKIILQDDRPMIYSPFGMGILDISLGRYIMQTAVAENRTHVVPDFLGTMARW